MNAPTVKPYSHKLLEKMELVQRLGFNVFMMYNTFKRRSKLREQIPEEVMQKVCDSYIKNSAHVKNTFPYFLSVLQKESGRYFARRNEAEGITYKKDPQELKNFFDKLTKEKGK